MSTGQNSLKGETSNKKRALGVAIFAILGLIANVVVNPDLTIREVIQAVVNTARAVGVSIP